MCFFFSFPTDFSKLFGALGSPSLGMCPRFLFIMVVIMIYLFVLDDSLTLVIHREDLTTTVTKWCEPRVTAEDESEVRAL